MLVMVVDVVI